ncbi:MAG: hypothetical protein H0W64_09535 [Gammaproteobacteria bacterium]|nr:hypothetical protein [Gammaproteobacteria bacterium]
MLSTSTFFTSPTEDRTKALLTTGLKHVLSTCVLGASNKMEDIEKTNGWVCFQQFRYHKRGNYRKTNALQLTNEDKTEFYFDSYNTRELFVKTNKKWFYHCKDYASAQNPDPHFAIKFSGLNPLWDPEFHLQENHRNVLLLAIIAQAKRAGKCSERACLLAKYLWEHKKGIQRIETISFNFDHVIVIVNREGNLADPKTWGKAQIVDGWYPKEGSIYSAKEFIQKAKEVREFMMKEDGEQYKIGMSYKKKDFPAEIRWSCREEIFPQVDIYPTYSTSPFYPVEYYYNVLNAYTLDLFKSKDDFDPMAEEKAQHEKNFKDCLSQIVRLPSLKIK